MTNRIYFTQLPDPASFPDKMSKIFSGPGLFRYKVQRKQIKVWQVQHFKKLFAGRDNWFEVKTPGHYYLTVNDEDQMLTIHPLMTKEQIAEHELRFQAGNNGVQAGNEGDKK